jgi:hypothetical protein
MAQTTELLSPQETESLLQSWNLSEAAIAVLMREPELVAHLQEARSLPPFPPGYVPAVIEELFDDLPYRRWEWGQALPVYERPCPPDYEPPFVEYSFDDETALFQVQGEIIVNRMNAMAEYANYFEGLMEV